MNILIWPVFGVITSSRTCTDEEIKSFFVLVKPELHYQKIE